VTQEVFGFGSQGIAHPLCDVANADVLGEFETCR
jgi:hypothetical protein